MAQYVAQGAGEVPDTAVRIRSVEEATNEDVLWCDGLAVGSPTYLGLLSWRMKRFWDGVTGDMWGQVDGKIACAFSSSGGWGGGTELTCLSLLILLVNFGFLVFGVPDYVADKFTLHYGAVTAGAPEKDKGGAACVRLGQRLAQWVAVFVDGRQQLHPGPVGQR
jgi:NAD(P)H dehydrogenase (quinone)